MNVIFSEAAWREYVDWQGEDRKTLKSINKLIQSIMNDGLLGGLGKPERLKHIDGYSRRIDDKNRLLYAAQSDGSVEIISCKGHYEDQ
ncbi:MAG: Txe/YoeB family addiction module toxin [Clostridiales Family XIII bacterium]|jgi:toxin YoeB|nr:Txe/YoeB family addiction module toxin [Clostridiales Family XIII bacterium]